MDLVYELSFLRGNCVKYIWRAGRKAKAKPDLQKARQYLNLLVQHAPQESASVSGLDATVRKYVLAEPDNRRSSLISTIVLSRDPVEIATCLGSLDDWISTV